MTSLGYASSTKLSPQTSVIFKKKNTRKDINEVTLPEIRDRSHMTIDDSENLTNINTTIN